MLEFEQTLAHRRKDVEYKLTRIVLHWSRSHDRQHFALLQFGGRLFPTESSQQSGLADTTRSCNAYAAAGHVLQQAIELSFGFRIYLILGVVNLGESWSILFLKRSVIRGGETSVNK